MLSYKTDHVFSQFKQDVEDFVGLADGVPQGQYDEQYNKVLKSTEELLTLCISSVVFTGMKGDGADSLFANILYRVNKEVGVDIETAMAVGIKDRGVTLFINPFTLYETVSNIRHVVSIVKHECYHIVFKHLTYLKSKQWTSSYIHTLFNIATDCQINQLLTGLPDNCVTLAYVNELTEQQLKPNGGSLYYLEALINSPFGQQLKANEEKLDTFINEMSKQQGQSGKGESGDSGVSEQLKKSWDELMDSIDNLTPSQQEKLKRAIMSHKNWKESASQADIDTMDGLMGELVKDAYDRLTEKQRGTLPGSVQEAIDALSKKRSIDWRSMVRRGLGSIPVPYRKTKKRLNRRQPERITLSGRMMDRQVELVVFIDTSGSMSNTDIAYSLGEIEQMIKDIRAHVEVVMFDTKIQAVYPRLRDVKKIKTKGRGGTSFAPAFEYLKDKGYSNRDTLAVFFTDGFGESESQINRYGFNNVYWVITGEQAKITNLSCDGKGRVALLKEDVRYNKKVLGKNY